MNSENIVNKPFVSIIIPVYNVERFLRHCLDSLVFQTFKDIEIVCINDCSTDNSLSILKEYAKTDTRIKIIDFKENKGVSIARNEGIKQAKGNYLAFIDGDDCVDLDFFEKLYLEAKRTNADIVKADTVEVLENGKTRHDLFKINQNIKEFNDKFFFVTYWVCAIYKASLVKENNIFFDTTLTNGEDGLFLTEILTNAKNIAVIDNSYYYYIRHKDSANKNLLDKKAISSLVASYKRILSILNNIKNIKKEAYLFVYNFYIDNCIKLIFRTNQPEIKHQCIQESLNIFNMCYERENLYRALLEKFTSIADLYAKNDLDTLYNTMSDIEYTKFMAANFRKKCV